MKPLCPFCLERPLYWRLKKPVTCGHKDCRRAHCKVLKRQDYKKNPEKHRKYNRKSYLLSKGPEKLEAKRKYQREWKVNKRKQGGEWLEKERARRRKYNKEKQAKKLYLQQKVFNLDEGLLPVGLGNFM